MARIAKEELERLKREVSVQRLAETRGVKLKRHGADLIGLCPFHEDREPSLVISPQKNLWHCLGACQAGGSVIDWVIKKAEGVSFRHAVELLRSDFPFLAAEKPLDAEQVVKKSTVKKLEIFAEPDETDAAVLGRVVDYYHATLKESPEALGYLRERGLVHEDLIDRFRLGYADRTLEGLVAKQERGRLMRLHQNAQRLLMPVHVVNPFAKELHFADHATRTRRDHAKYLTLIDAIALLHQHQRPVKSAYVGGAEIRYIEVTQEDIEIANKLAGQVLSRGLDELAPQTRRLLDRLYAMVRSECARQGVEQQDYRFSRRQVRERLSMCETQLRAYLWRLVQMEYVLVHKGSRGRSYAYELLYQPGEAQKDSLGSDDTGTTELRGVFAGASRGPDREVSLCNCQDLSNFAGCAGRHISGEPDREPSYAQVASAH